MQFTGARETIMNLRSLIPGRRAAFIAAATLLIYTISYAILAFVAPTAIETSAFAPLRALISGVADDSAENNGRVLQVGVIEVQLTETTPSVEVSGAIEYLEKIDVVSKTSGRIERIFVNKGDSVKKGQALVQIERLPLQLQATQQRAALEGERAQLKLVEERYEKARRDAERSWQGIARQETQARELRAILEKARSTFKAREIVFNAGGISREEYENARTELISREAEYLRAKKDLEILTVGYRERDLQARGFPLPASGPARFKALVDFNTQLERAEVEVQRARVRSATAERENTNVLLRESTIRSPIDGFVAARNRNAGEEVREGSVATPQEAILVLVDIARVYAAVTLKENDSTKVKSDMPLSFTVDVFPDEVREARVKLIDPLVDSKTHTMEIRALLENTGLKLRPGMFLRGRILTGTPRKMLLVPSKALQPREGDRATVFVVRDKRVFQIPVKTGETVDESVEIVEGLKPGDLLAVDKLSLLRDGLTIEPIQAESAPHESH